MTTSTQIFKCPRRHENGTYYLTQAESPFNYPVDDHWEIGTSFSGRIQDTRFHNCSYCGSIEPEEFLDFLEKGWYLIPTDKNYKAYLGEPLAPDQQRSYIPDEVVRLKRLEDHTYEPDTVKHEQVGKFYFQHLAAEQRDRFIRIYNDRKCMVGAPGYLYVTPYFASKKADD